ncbi:aldose epimerase [Caldicellulosiruptoraceae bacterium PP1]
MNFLSIRNENNIEIYNVKSKEGKSFFEVAKDRGAIVTKINLMGKDILYLNQETLFDFSKNIRGGIPILFPVCGRVIDNKISFKNNTYIMKNHGFARDLQWRYEGLYESIEETGIIFSLNSNQKTLEMYPYEFKIVIVYKIKEDAFSIHFNIENRSEEPLPFYAGFHPYFLCNKDQFEIQFDCERGFDDLLKREISEDDYRYLDFSKDEINLDFYNVKSPVLFSLSNDVKLEMDFDSSYKNLVIWSLKGFPYVCIEPWMGEHEGYLKDDFIYLEKGEIHSTYVDLKLK